MAEMARPAAETVCVRKLSGDVVLSCRAEVTVGQLRAQAACALGLPRAQVALLQGARQLLDGECLAGRGSLELTAALSETPRYDPECWDEAQLPALECMLCSQDAKSQLFACERLCHFDRDRLSLSTEGLEAVLAVVGSAHGELKDHPLQLLANFLTDRWDARSNIFFNHAVVDEEAAAPRTLAAETLEARERALEAGALPVLLACAKEALEAKERAQAALPGLDACAEEWPVLELPRAFDLALFRLLTGRPAPAPEVVRPAVPLLIDLFFSGRDELLLACANQLFLQEEQAALLLEAGLLRQLAMVFDHGNWSWSVLRLLRTLLGSDERHYRAVLEAGMLPLLLDSRAGPLPPRLARRPQGLEKMELQEVEQRPFDVACLELTALLAGACGRAASAAAPCKQHLALLCGFLEALTAKNNAEQLARALPHLLPALASFRPSPLHPRRSRAVAKALRAVLQAGGQYRPLVEAAGFHRWVLARAMGA